MKYRYTKYTGDPLEELDLEELVSWIGDAALAGRFAEAMLERGVYVVGFSYPVVPQGRARIRTQVSAAHTREDLDFALDAFAAVKQAIL